MMPDFPERELRGGALFAHIFDEVGISAFI
jgi:hypothetical protein